MKNNSKRKSIVQNVIVRILFYGLFLLGPCIMSEAHAVYGKMIKECSQVEDDDSKRKIYDKYRYRIRALDILGASCFCLWLLWLFSATAFKIAGKITRKNNYNKKWGGKNKYNGMECGLRT